MIEVTISGGVTDIETFDNNDGTYRVDYKITDASTTHDLSVTVNRDLANVKTSTITTVPNLPDARSSTMVTDTLIVLDDTHTVDVDVFDGYGNRILSQDPIVLVVHGHDSNLHFTFSPVAPSVYQLAYAVPSGTDDVSRCGFYTLSSFLLV